MGNNSTNNIIQAVSLLTLTSVALAYSLHKTKSKIMPKEEKTISYDDIDLPNPNFKVCTIKNSRSQSLFAINLPPKHHIIPEEKVDENDTTKFRTENDRIVDRKLDPPKAMFFLSHGVMEHCLRQGYIGLYESLSEAGVDVYSLDHSGHGRSEGQPRGYIEKFDHYVEDLVAYIKKSQQVYLDRDGVCPPLILMGQSMGALISIMTAWRLGSYHIDGLILTSPALGVDMDLQLKIQKMIAPALDKLLPKAKIVDAVRPKDLSRNPQAVQAYIDDEYVTKGKLIVRTAIQVDKTFDIAKDRRGEITCPILLMHGTDDRCTSINASRDFFEYVGTAKGKKRFLELPGMYHELFEEGEASEELIVSIVEFTSSGGKQFAEISGEEESGLVKVEFK